MDFDRTAHKYGDPARLVDDMDIAESWFCGNTEAGVQIFIGSNEIAVGPVWYETSGKQNIDFARSYAVQVVPSLYLRSHEILLEGGMAILRMSAYEDEQKAKELTKLFRQLKKTLIHESDQKIAIKQTLTNGQQKLWKSICVGKQVSEAHTAGLRLKQFLRGPVEFDLEPIRSIQGE